MSFYPIAVIYDKSLKPETEQPAQQAIKKINKHDSFVAKANPTDFYRGIAAAIVYGGDGLLLHSSYLVAPYDIPLLGISYGRVGYLCKVKPVTSDTHILVILDVLDDIYSNKLQIADRTRISAEINGKLVADALNEISIGGINRTVYLDLHFKTDEVYNLKSIGDGIIFSTRTGSTAYNVNAGGPVIFDNNVFSIVANNSVFQSDNLPFNTKSMVVGTDRVFKVKIANKNKDNTPYLIADGQRTVKLDKDDEIIIKKSPYTTKLIII